MLSLFTNLATRLRRDEKGATAVEYGIMVALIAVVIIVAVTLLGGTLNDMFNRYSAGQRRHLHSRRAASTTPLAEPAPSNRSSHA